MDNQTSQPVIAQPNQHDDDGINFIDLLIVLASHKKMIIGVTLAAVLLGVWYSLRLPNIYTGRARILPPQQSQSSANSLLNQLGGLAGAAGGSLGLKNPGGIYIAMLQSRTPMENVAKRFDLQNVYGQKTVAGTLMALEGNTSISASKEGIITVEVSDLEPKRAAEMANAFVEELNKLIQNFALTDAGQRRAFFEQQLKQARNKLTDAELVLDKTPNTSLRYLDAVRNLKYQEALWEILAKQFEMAKLDEAKDYPLIQILDSAIPPDRKSKPVRSKIVFLAGLVAFILTVILAFISESMSRTRQRPEQLQRMHALRNAFKWRRQQ